MSWTMERIMKAARDAGRDRRLGYIPDGCAETKVLKEAVVNAGGGTYVILELLEDGFVRWRDYDLQTSSDS